VAHWTQVLADVSTFEFVALAVLTTLQWARHRIRGAGWVALSFAILGGLSLTVKIDPGIVLNQTVAKSLIALLLVMPYCLFRFATVFRRPSAPVRYVAVLVTVAIIAFTFSLQYVPLPGLAPPPHFLAYRIAFALAFGFLFTYVVVRLSVAGTGEPPLAATRMHLLALAVAGLEVQVAVAALGLQGAGVTLATQAISVAMGILFLVALVLPSFVRVFLSRREDVAFRRAIGELVSAGDSRDVAERLLPHVCALVGATKAALLAGDGTVVARFPVWTRAEGGDEWSGGPAAGDGPHRITVRTDLHGTHVLAVEISAYLPYFGSEELHRLDELAGMLGLAIERCEMAEQVAFQASHDALTGLANRSLFLERLEEAMVHVGRRRSALSVMFIDLDRFKLVNDRADHTAGDIVLREMADRLRTMTRGVDVVARFGGDEFVAFAEVDHEEDAIDMAERIRRGLSEPVEVGQARLVISASIGVVVSADGDTTAASLLRDADNAMYEAKRSGRDQVAVYKSNARDVANLKWGLSPIRNPQASAG
jgi:diguanylate cyclase (GGDEF)-like protein